MKTAMRYIILLLSAYFMLFSVLPQDYTFLGKLASSIEKMTSDASDLESCNTGEAEEDDESSPPTLVEEEDTYISEHSISPIIPTENYTRYYLNNENCKGISPSTPLPPPDIRTA